MTETLKTRVLIVDDEEVIRILLEQTVSGAGYHVTTASDGDEAISKIRMDRFDVALLDIQMPNSTGIDVLKYLQENSPRTRVIMLTGHPDLRYAMEAKEFGAMDFIRKPYSVEDVLQTIERVLMNQDPR